MVWMTLIFWLVTFIISYALRPKPNIENARASKLSSINFPRASAGAPVPVIFGKVRVRSCNTAWIGNFKAVAQTVKVKTGMFSSKDQIVGYNYHISMDLTICQGPDVSLHQAWADKKRWLDRTSSPINGNGVSATINQANLFGGKQKGGGMAGVIRWYSGGFTQSRNTYISGKATNGADYPAYVGIAHVCFENRTQVIKIFGQTFTIVTPFYIGTQASLKPLNFEVSRYPDNLGLGSNRLIGDDLNPAEIIYSLLVDDWNGLGLSSTLIDTTSFTSVGNTLFTEGNGASLVIDSANDVKEVISELLRQVDGIIYQDPTTGKLVLKLIRADYSIPSLPVFDETNVESVQVFARSSWAETSNQVRVIFNSRDKKYSDATAFVQDQANVSMQGRVRSVELSFPGVTTEALALSIATRELSQLTIPLYRATLKTTRVASLLKPGDPFVFSWSKYGINQVVMRLHKFDAGELIQGNVILDCIQDKFAAANTLYSSPGTGLDDPGTITATSVTKYAVFESPYIFVNRLDYPFAVTADSSYLWALARDPVLRQDGYDLITSDDNFVDKIITEINHVGFPMSCELVGSLFKEMGMATGVVGKINIRNLDPESSTFSTQAAADIRTTGKGIILITGSAGIEFAAYEGYTDNGDGTYSLDNVHRALIDTKFVDHVDGDIIYFITGVEWLSQVFNPDTATIKYQILTYTATDAQDLGDFTAQTIVLSQRYDKPLPPDFMKVESVRNPIEVLSATSVNITDFLERNRTTPDEFVLLDDSTDTPESSTTYTARLYLDNVLITTSSSLTYAGLPFNLSGLFGSGIVRVELDSVRTVGSSWTTEFLEFFYANYQNLSAERLTNPGFESSVGTGWTTQSGSWNNPTTAWPLDPVRTVGAATDDNHLESTGTTNELRQEYTIPGGDVGKSAILRAWKGGKGSATGQIVVELRDATNLLKSVSTPVVAAANVGKWELIEIPLSLRSDATKVRVRVIAAAAGSCWDNISLKNHTTSPTSTLDYSAITGVTVKGAWGLRKMVAAYSGALVRVRDTFDDSEQDVGIDPDGNLEPFFVRGQARVVRLYDQSGNGANLESATSGKQPRLMWNLTETGRPYIDFAGGYAIRDITAGTTRPYMTTRPNLCMALGPKRDSSAAFIATIPHDSGHNSPYYRWGLATAGTDYRWSVDGTEENDPGNSAINSGKHVVWIDYQNGNLYENDDAVAADTFTAANITYPNSTRLRIGEDGGGTNPWTGHFSELCIFDGNIAAADRKTIMEAVALYWYNLAI